MSPSAYRYVVCVARMTPERASALLGTNARASRTTVHRAWSTKAATLGVKGLVARDVLYRIADELDDEEPAHGMEKAFRDNWTKAGLSGVEWLLYAIPKAGNICITMLGKKSGKWVLVLVLGRDVFTETSTATKITPLLNGIKTLLKSQQLMAPTKWLVYPEGQTFNWALYHKLTSMNMAGVPFENALYQLKEVVKGPAKKNPYIVEVVDTRKKKHTDKWREMFPFADSDITERSKLLIAELKENEGLQVEIKKELSVLLERLQDFCAKSKILVIPGTSLPEDQNKQTASRFATDLERAFFNRPERGMKDTVREHLRKNLYFLGKASPAADLQHEWAVFCGEYDDLKRKWFASRERDIELNDQLRSLEGRQRNMQRPTVFKIVINGKAFVVEDSTLMPNPDLYDTLNVLSGSDLNKSPERKLWLLNLLEDSMTTEPTWAFIKVREVIEYLESHPS